MCKSNISPENIRNFPLDNCVHPVEDACVLFVDARSPITLSTQHTQGIHKQNVDNSYFLGRAFNFPAEAFSSEFQLLFELSVNSVIPVRFCRNRA